MRKLTILGLALVPFVSASAQKSTELSLSIANLTWHHVTGSSATQFDVGGAGVALGFYLSEGMALEPSAQLQYNHSEGESFTQLALGLALPIYFNKDWGHSGAYFAPRVGLHLVHFDQTTSQFYFGGELGTKARVSDAVSLRFGANVNYFPKNNDYLSAVEVRGFFGVSVFFK